ncbi:MAG: Pvc16 family protein [Gammaproteobacteria bacterium]
MLHDLDALVESERAIENLDVSFAAPDETFPPQGVNRPAMSFFLYDVRENYDLRTNQWGLKQQDGMFTRKRPPVRVDC